MEWDQYWTKGTWMTRLVDWAHRCYFSKIFASRVAQFVRPRSLVLDAGCGTGVTSRRLHESTQSAIVGLDISLPALRISSRYLPDTIRGDLQHLPFKSECFDVVYNQGVMEHFPSPWQAAEDFTRVLRRNGLVILLVPYSFSPLRFAYVLLKTLRMLRFWIGEEQTFLSKNDLLRLLRLVDCRPILIDNVWLTTLLGVGVKDS